MDDGQPTVWLLHCNHIFLPQTIAITKANTKKILTNTEEVKRINCYTTQTRTHHLPL